MRYLLDTNFCVALIRRTSPGAERRLTEREVTDGHGDGLQPRAAGAEVDPPEKET